MDNADPSGMLLSSLNVAMGMAARITIGAATFAAIWVLAAPRIAMLGATANLRPLATSLQVRIRPRAEIKTERDNDPQHKWFVHGSSSGFWAGATGIVFHGGQGKLGSDFGIGFYTLEASTEGINKAIQYAQRARRDDARGQGFILVVRVDVGVFNEMKKINLGTRTNPTSNYHAFVMANRASPSEHNVDYVYGATATQSPPESGNWVNNPSCPEQYKFERSAETKLERYAIIPVI